MADFEQPASFAFDAESETEIAHIVAKYPEGRQASAVIPALYVAQRQMKRQTGSAWVPVKAMDAVAHRLGMAPIRVYEVTTFYFMFNTAPVGKYHLQVCTTTPCWLRGSDQVVAACRKVTGIKGWGETSADGQFTMTEGECLGACVNAPMAQINDYYYEDLTPQTLGQIIDDFRAGKAPKPGSYAGRHTCEPAGGATTLTDPALYDGSKAAPVKIPNAPEPA